MKRHALSAASGGSVALASEVQPGQVSLAWAGGDLVLLMPAGPEMGMASVVVDESDEHVIDLYSPVPMPQQPVLVLLHPAQGGHQVTITPRN
jgi:hypothetical protein